MSLIQTPAAPFSFLPLESVAAAEQRQYSASAKSQSAPAALEQLFMERQVLPGAASTHSVRSAPVQDFSMLECFD